MFIFSIMIIIIMLGRSCEKITITLSLRLKDDNKIHIIFFLVSFFVMTSLFQEYQKRFSIFLSEQVETKRCLFIWQTEREKYANTFFLSRSFLLFIWFNVEREMNVAWVMMSGRKASKSNRWFQKTRSRATGTYLSIECVIIFLPFLVHPLSNEVIQEQPWRLSNTNRLKHTFSNKSEKKTFFFTPFWTFWSVSL